MAKKSEKNILVGLDIGTSKVVALVGEVSAEGELHIIGIGSHPSHGLKRGVVVNIEETVLSIARAVEEAELMAGCQISSVYAGIAGSHVHSLNSHGVVGIRENEVTHDDIERVMDAAKAVAIPADQKILHILPQEFIIDGETGIKEPMGMAGVRLESKVHMITGSVSAAQNIVNCVRRCSLEVDDIILEQLASSFACLSEAEKELGVCLVDIGGGTTDIAIFSNGAIVHTAVIPSAGDHVTNDLSVALRISTDQAESVKKEFGFAIAEIASHEADIVVNNVGSNKETYLSQHQLASIIEPRYEEIFSLVAQEIKLAGLEKSIGAGIVLTGGSSLVPAVDTLAQDMFQLPVRVGVPTNIVGLADVVKNPQFSTAVGLLLYGFRQLLSDQSLNWNRNLNGFWGRMKRWFHGNF